VIVFLHWHGGVGGARYLEAGDGYNKYNVAPDGAFLGTNGLPWPGRTVDTFAKEAEELLAPRRPLVLYQTADLVCIAEVAADRELGGESNLPAGRRHRVVTLLLIHMLKGAIPSSLIDVVPPVPVGNTFDLAPFSVHERVLVFLKLRSDGRYGVAGGHDGKHRIGDFTTDHVLHELADIQGIEGLTGPPPN
jgi:hypothetical protein